jgi:hypothetical protein
MMSKDIKQNVAADSAEDTNNRKASNELGQALKDEVKTERPVDKDLFKESPIPVFMRDSSEGHQGNAQDEKDEVGE